MLRFAAAEPAPLQISRYPSGVLRNLGTSVASTVTPAVGAQANGPGEACGRTAGKAGVITSSLTGGRSARLGQDLEHCSRDGFFSSPSFPPISTQHLSFARHMNPLS